MAKRGISQNWAHQSDKAIKENNLLLNKTYYPNPFSMLKHKLLTDLEPKLSNDEPLATKRCLTNIYAWLDSQIEKNEWIKKKDLKKKKPKVRIKQTKSIITRYTGWNK